MVQATKLHTFPVYCEVPNHLEGRLGGALLPRVPYPFHDAQNVRKVTNTMYTDAISGESDFQIWCGIQKEVKIRKEKLPKGERLRWKVNNLLWSADATEPRSIHAQAAEFLASKYRLPNKQLRQPVSLPPGCSPLVGDFPRPHLLAFGSFGR